MYSFQSYVYHTLFIDGITYLCATDNGLDSMAPSAFLKKVSNYSYCCAAILSYSSYEVSALWFISKGATFLSAPNSEVDSTEVPH